MYIKKFYDMESSDVMSSGETDAPATESAPSETMSIAALMAKEGVKSDSEGTDFNPVRVNRDGSWESESSKAEAPVATTKEEATQDTNSESSQSNSKSSVPEPQKEDGRESQTNWQNEIKNQQPEDVLKAMGFDDKMVSFIQGMKEIDPKMVGFLNTWKEGGDVKQYFDEASKDYSTMPAEDVMRHQLREEYPKATEAQLDVLYKKEIVEKYNLNSYDEDEVAEGKLLLDAKADKFRDNLIEAQQNKLLPQPPDYSAQQQAETQRVQEFTNRIVSDFNDNPYTKEVLSKNSITIGEGADKFSFPIDGKEISELVINGDANGDLMFERKTGADGQESFVPKAQHQLLVATVNKYGDKFITELAKHYKSLGGKAAIEPIDNARPVETRNTSNASPEPTSVVGAMAKYGKFNSGGW